MGCSSFGPYLDSSITKINIGFIGSQIILVSKVLHKLTLSTYRPTFLTLGTEVSYIHGKSVGSDVI